MKSPVKYSQYRATYGLSAEQFNSLILRSEGRCEACGRATPDLGVDHCHEFVIMRGMLCISCNTSLGRMKENPDALRALAAYIERDWDAEGTIPEYGNSAASRHAQHTSASSPNPSDNPSKTKHRKDTSASNRRLLLRRYGLTEKQLDLLVVRSEGRCECCETPSRQLCVNHGKDGRIRGLVCRPCSFALAMADPTNPEPKHIWAWLNVDWDKLGFWPTVRTAAVARRQHRAERDRAMVGMYYEG